MRLLRNRRARGMWADVDALVAWLDTNDQSRWWWSPGRRRAVRDHELTLRIAKCAEELGEVVDARIRVLGQNPRKHDQPATGDDVANELCDVIVTAMVALHTQAGGADAARACLEGRFTKVRARVAA